MKAFLFLLSAGLLFSSCATRSVVNQGRGYYLLRCETDVVYCYDLGRSVCESPFEVRSERTHRETGEIEVYVKCER